MSASLDTTSSPTVCAYCKSLNKKDAHTHTREHCPEIMKLDPCVHCHASGIHNHTASHCPERKKPQLELIRVQKAPWKGLPVPLVAYKDSYKENEHPAEWMWIRHRLRRGGNR